MDFDAILTTRTPGPTPEEDLRAYAFARVALGDLIPHVQVSWVKLGHTQAQACLQVGADDYGGTLMDESISRLAGSPHGQWAAPVEIEAHVQAIGRVPRQRTTTYGAVAPPLRMG